jgi:hypothetical protein
VAEVLRLADEGWAWFGEAARTLDPDAWDEEVPGGGWTRRKMFNHIRVWHELTGQRLRSFRETGARPPSPGDVDVINAQAAADADLRSREMIIDEMEATYRHLRDEVARLRDDQLAALDGWPVAEVAENTWDHYEEHRADVLQATP